MTIAKSAVSDFLNRELDDFSFLKEWRREDLWEELRNLEVRPRITSPHPHWHHQLVGLLLMCVFNGFLLFLNMGSGKTRILLEAFAYRRRAGHANKALICVLNDTNVFAIEDDAKIHTPQFKVCPLVGSFQERWELLEESDSHVHVVSYAGLRNMCCKTVETEKGNVFKPDEKLIKRLLKQIDWVAYDEIHKCKNHKGVTYSVAKKVSRGSKFHYGSTGTGFGRNPEDLWAQFFLCDKGESLGSTLGLFRAAFFAEKDNYWGGKEYTFDRRQQPEFQAAIKHRSIYYKDSELRDMPRRRQRTILLRPAKPLAVQYNEAIERFNAAQWGEDKKQSWIRLRMLCSGYCTYDDDEEGKVQIEFPDNPKVEQLESFLDQVPFGYKGIIVHEFIHSGKIIERVLKEHGHTFLSLNGATKKKDRRRIYTAFRKDKRHRFLVMNWRSGGTGGNYQISPYMFFFESPVSPIERKQTEYRIRRGDSKRKRVYYRDPIIQGSVEEDILQFHKEGKNLWNELMGGNSKRKLRSL